MKKSLRKLLRINAYSKCIILYDGLRSEYEHFSSNINHRRQKELSFEIRNKAYATRYAQYK
jgi:hypothetical protein